jgi:hypothetical protein
MTGKSKGRHTFAFDGGEILTTIGATFFVSYLYNRYVDATHHNWDAIATKSSRISNISRSTHYHRYWLERVSSMNEANLNKNTLGLSGSQVIEMAKAVLDRMK